jgi:phage gp46-like protein
MLRLSFDNKRGFADLVRLPTGAFDTDDGLETAVIASVFTDRAAEPGEGDEGSMRRGWWADLFAATSAQKLGSRIWLLRRSTLSNAVLLLLQTYAAEALQWLVDDKVAKGITCVATRVSSTAAQLTITIERPNEPSPWSRSYEVPFGSQ